MTSRRVFSTLFKTMTLLAAALVVLLIYRTHHPPPVPLGGGDNDEDDIKYSPIVPVSVAPLQIQTLHEFLSAYGTVETGPALPGRPPAGANVSVISPGLVTRVDVVEGQPVTAEQTLFQLDSREVDAQIAAARRALADADEDVNRLLEAGKTSPGSEQWLPRARRDQDRARAELADAQARKGMLTITAPLTGTVAELLICSGEIADPAKPAMKIVDLDRLTVAVNVPGPQLRTLSLEQEAEIVERSAPSAAAAPSSQPTTGPENASDPPSTQPAILRGKIVFIDPLIDPQTGLGQAFVSLPRGSGLRPGEFVKVRIIIRTHAGALAAPSASIVRDASGKAGVNVVVRDFRWAFRHNVRVGIADGDWVEVEGPGLKAGDNVVTTGAFALPDRSRISVNR